MKEYVLAAMMLVLSVSAGFSETERTISTTGVGTVEAVPDMATISMGVTHESVEAAAAMAATSEGVGAILARLVDAGVDSRDIQTSNISLQPVWSRRTNDANTPPRITGFVASNTLTIRVRDLAILGGVLDAVVRDGANMFNGLSFGLQDPEPVMAEARALAVRNAMEKAKEIADAAGIGLGAVQSLSEQGGMRPQMMDMAAARMADVPVAAGEVGISAQVSAVFAIAD
jgi:uncharacterized protein YggE